MRARTSFDSIPGILIGSVPRDPCGLQGLYKDRDQLFVKRPHWLEQRLDLRGTVPEEVGALLIQL